MRFRDKFENCMHPAVNSDAGVENLSGILSAAVLRLAAHPRYPVGILQRSAYLGT